MNEALVNNGFIPVTARQAPDCSKRATKHPAYVHDYHYNITDTDIPYLLVAYLSYEKISDGYTAYICLVNLHVEPTSFTQAKRFYEWIKEMNEELITLENNDTWIVYSLLLENVQLDANGSTK